MGDVYKLYKYISEDVPLNLEVDAEKLQEKKRALDQFSTSFKTIEKKESKEDKVHPYDQPLRSTDDVTDKDPKNKTDKPVKTYTKTVVPIKDVKLKSEKKVEEVEADPTISVIAKGISDQFIADRIAREKQGKVVSDPDDETKYMIIKTDESIKEEVIYLDGRPTYYFFRGINVRGWKVPWAKNLEQAKDMANDLNDNSLKSEDNLPDDRYYTEIDRKGDYSLVSMSYPAEEEILSKHTYLIPRDELLKLDIQSDAQID